MNKIVDEIIEKEFASIEPKHDVVKHPRHYCWHPSGVECIEIVKQFNFCLGGAIKYLWRAEHSGKKLQDLEKAKQLIEFEIERIRGTE